MTAQQYSVPYGRDRANAIYTDAMARMYSLVALGIMVTGAAIWVGDMFGIGLAIYELGFIGIILFFGATLGLLFGANAAVGAGNIGLGMALYLVFTTVEGLFISPILQAYDLDTIGLAFLMTGGLFIAMSAIGMTTKKDLSKLGSMLLIGLVGVLIVSLVNVFLIGSGMLALLINIILLPIFLGLTVWQTKQVKELAQEAAMNGDDKAATQIAVIGSIGLYVNVLNIFLIILSLLGGSRE